MPAPNDKMFGKHGGFPGQGNAWGRPDFVDDKIPFLRDPPPPPPPPAPPPPPPDCISVDIDVGLWPLHVFVFSAADAAYCFEDTIAGNSFVYIYDFGADDVINVSGGNEDTYSFTTDGDDLIITALIGVFESRIVLYDVLTSPGLVFDYESASEVVGHDFMIFDDEPLVPAGECLEQSIDFRPPAGAVRLVDAGAGAFCFQDTIGIDTDVTIRNFGPDDVINVLDGTENTYAFGTSGDGDLRIVYSDGTNFNQIIIEDVITTGFVFDYDSAVAAVGHEFMTFAASRPVSIDVGGPFAPVTFNAAVDRFSFLDDATVDTEVILQSFGPDDVIEVTGALKTDYNFARSFDDINDLVITYVHPTGGVNTIVIDDLLPDTGPAVNYDQVAALIGFEFMTFG
ncbi:MAG: hypothetical protein R3D89_10605 [Sphingomonadaceae bacterium]